MKYLGIILIFFPYIASAQVFHLKGVVKNAETKDPIPYVNIGIFNKSIGTVSNENGLFEISINNDHTGEKLNFSHINFAEDFILINDSINDSISIFLSPKDFVIPEVIVKGRKRYTIGEIGTTKNERSAKGFFKAKGLGAEAGTLIQNPDACSIISFNMNVLENSFDGLTFRLNFYNIKSKKPYEKIAPETIFNLSEKEIGQITLNLEDKNININGDFIVSIELIDFIEGEKANPELYFSAYQGNKAITYGREIGMDKWEKYKDVGCSFWMKIEK